MKLETHVILLGKNQGTQTLVWCMDRPHQMRPHPKTLHLVMDGENKIKKQYSREKI